MMLVAAALACATIVRAEPLIDGDVYVDPAITDSSLLADRLTQRLLPGDGLLVVILPEGATVDMAIGRDDQTLLLAVGNKVFTRASGWPRQIVLDQKLQRVNAVASTGIDKLLAMIREVHQWQVNHPKPLPPPPPPPPFDWTPYIIAAPTAFVIGGILFLVVRRRRLIRRLSKNAEVPVDIPDLDDYLKGMK